MTSRLLLIGAFYPAVHRKKRRSAFNALLRDVELTFKRPAVLRPLSPEVLLNDPNVTNDCMVQAHHMKESSLEYSAGLLAPRCHGFLQVARAVDQRHSGAQKD